MVATTPTVVTKRVINTKLPAFKCHVEVDLSSSESNTDEERPTKVPRVEVTTMSDSNWLCMPCDPRCVSPDFDDEDKKEKLRLLSQGKCVPGLIPKKKIVDKPMPPLIPDFFQGIPIAHTQGQDQPRIVHWQHPPRHDRGCVDTIPQRGNASCRTRGTIRIGHR